jgi:hypothetical protein
LGYLGPFIRLDNRIDGLWGEASILPTKATDVAALLDEGVNELSVEFRLPGVETANTKIDDSGIRWRTYAHLDAVALEPKGAYTNAQVMAYRAEMDDLEAEQARAEEALRIEEETANEAKLAAEAAAEAAIKRREAWEAMTGRVTVEQIKQRQLVEHYGLTQPGGFRRID